MMRFIIFFLLTGSLFLVACKNNDNTDLTENITGTYTGSMNVTSPSFQNTSYTLTVTKINNGRVRFTPSTNDVSTWEADITQQDATHIACVFCNGNQVSFHLNGTPQTLEYDYNSNEEFVGEKQ